MLRSLITGVAAWTVLLSAAARPIRIECHAAEPIAALANDTPFDGVVLLIDGGMLTGRISQSAGRYVVTRAGSELTIPDSKVSLVCRSLEDAYDQQRQRMSQPTAESHLALAEWCLRFELFPQAARELMDARGMDPRHPKLPLLERRLAVASRPHKPESESKALPAPQHSPAPSVAETESNPAVGNDLPNGVVEHFTRKIQPILVNNCTTTGCHQVGGPQQYQLDRAVLHGLSNRRSTTHNLTATLALVDHSNPQQSPLLTVPRRAHGGMSHAVFGPRQSQLVERLEEWVAMVTGTKRVEDEAAGVATDSGSEDEAADEPAANSKPARQKASPSKVSAAAAQETEKGTIAQPEVVTAAYDADALPPGPPPKVRFGAHVETWRPKDPFDPEIFNRQTPQKQASQDGPRRD